MEWTTFEQNSDSFPANPTPLHSFVGDASAFGFTELVDPSQEADTRSSGFASSIPLLAPPPPELLAKFAGLSVSTLIAQASTPANAQNPQNTEHSIDMLLDDRVSDVLRSVLLGSGMRAFFSELEPSEVYIAKLEARMKQLRTADPFAPRPRQTSTRTRDDFTQLSEVAAFSMLNDNPPDHISFLNNEENIARMQDYGAEPLEQDEPEFDDFEEEEQEQEQEHEQPPQAGYELFLDDGDEALEV